MGKQSASETITVGDDFGVPGFRRATKRRAFGCALEVI